MLGFNTLLLNSMVQKLERTVTKASKYLCSALLMLDDNENLLLAHKEVLEKQGHSPNEIREMLKWYGDSKTN